MSCANNQMLPQTHLCIAVIIIVIIIIVIIITCIVIINCMVVIIIFVIVIINIRPQQEVYLPSTKPLFSLKSSTGINS